MAKRKTEQMTACSDQHLDGQLIAAAIEQAKEMITAGSSKIAASIAIYNQLKDMPQQTVVDAFIAGASLTPKGALTYWYNCRRRIRQAD